MNPTPIYTEALREAKRRTRKGSPERADLVAMDERTAPSSAPIDHLAAQEPTDAEIEAAAVVIWESYDLLDRAAIRDALTAAHNGRKYPR